MNKLCADTISYYADEHSMSRPTTQAEFYIFLNIRLYAANIASFIRFTTVAVWASDK
jgi:hypothetical protein